MKKLLLVTFSDNADHQDTLFGMYEEMRKRSDWETYLLCIKTPKVELHQSDHTWLVDCPKRPGVTKNTFNLPLLLSIIHRVRKEHFDAIYFESLHTWNLPIMMMAGKARTYQVIHEVIPHEGDSQVKMVDLMNKAVVKFADTIVLRNKTYIQDMIDRYGISAGRVKYLELWRRYPAYTSPVHSGRALFFGRINPYKGADNLLEIVRLCPDIQFDVIGRVDPQMQKVVEQLAKEKNVKLNNDYVTDEEMREAFINCDWAIVPYNSASQSGIIIDAYKYSRPVIAFAVGAIPEQVDADKSGYLVTAGDNEKFADKLKEAAKLSLGEYLLSNNNANIRRVRQRIEELSSRSEFAGWTFPGGEAKINEAENRLQLIFEEKPDADQRQELKSNGFKWAPSQGAWQRQLNQNAIRAAARIDFLRPEDGTSPYQLQPFVKRENKEMSR